MRSVVVVLLAVLTVAGCEAPSEQPGPSTTVAPDVAAGDASPVDLSSGDVHADGVELDSDELRDELLAMREPDQAERSQFGDPDAGPWQDEDRTARLIELIDTYGWPTPDLVGEEASTAAWLIVQHSDADPAFQQRVLSLLTSDVPDYTGKAGQVALLTDRVATNTNRPQLYGSQIGCIDDTPVPRPDLERPDDVDQLRAEAGLEPLADYLARFDQHCTELARLPVEAGCVPITGVSGLLEPGTAILVGEIHGTVESPSFVDALACTALSYGYDVIVGVEIPADETPAVERFLASDGGSDAQSDLLAGSFWSSGFPDGRQSNAMFELLESVRQRVRDGATVDIVLLDANATTDRDRSMADHLVGALASKPDGVAITLTGNVHNRRTRGADFDPDYEPMGYLVTQRLGDDAVRSLDVRYTGGTAWGCSQDQTCGPRAFDANHSSEQEAGSFAVELFAQPSADGFDGAYFVGELTPSAPV